MVITLAELFEKKFQRFKSYGADTKVLWMDIQRHSYNGGLPPLRKRINETVNFPNIVSQFYHQCNGFLPDIHLAEIDLATHVLS